jgi:hypothetical protein
VHGQLPTPWDEARFAKIQEVTKRLKLDTDLLPEDV